MRIDHPYTLFGFILFSLVKKHDDKEELTNKIINNPYDLCREELKQNRKMKKNVFKATFAVVAIAAVGLGSYKAYDSYTAANMSEEDLLLTEDVLALSDPVPKGNGEKKTKDGGFEDCDIMVCSSCGLQAPGSCFWSCSYTVPLAGHRYNCKSGSRLTESECTGLIKAYPPHPKSSCSGHTPSLN